MLCIKWHSLNYFKLLGQWSSDFVCATLMRERSEWQTWFSRDHYLFTENRIKKFHCVWLWPVTPEMFLHWSQISDCDICHRIVALLYCLPISNSPRRCCHFANSLRLCRPSLCHHKFQRTQVMIGHWQP